MCRFMLIHLRMSFLFARKNIKESVELMNKMKKVLMNLVALFSGWCLSRKKIMKIKKLATLAIFISFSVIGAIIKIPAVIGSIAFDSFPALIAAILLGPISGAVVAAIGHLVSALVAGFPLGPFHLLISAEMAFILFVFGYFYQKGSRVIAYSLFILTNGVLAAVPFIFIISLGFYIALLPSLLIGTIINAVVAIISSPKLVAFQQMYVNRNGQIHQ